MKLVKYSLSVVCVIAMIGLVGCGAEKKLKKGKKIRSVKVVNAQQMRMVEMLETTGDVIAVNTVTLRATVEGPIKYCPWREGDTVKKGAKLIGINRPLYREQFAVKKAILKDLQYGPRPEEIAMAKAEVVHLESCTKFAKIDFDRINQLAGKDVISTQKRDKIEVNYRRCSALLRKAKNRLKMLEEGTKETELAIAEANLALAKAKVDECTMYAPFAGIITMVYVRPGDLTTLSSPRTPLLKMIDPESLIVRAGLPESSEAYISKGTKVMIHLDAYPGKVFKAVINRIHPRIEWSSRTRIVEIKILDTVKLIPRMFARVLVQGRVIKDAVVVLDSAIITTPRGAHLVYVVRDGKAEMRKVKIGLEKGNLVQINEGVKAGEQVITAGNINLKNGTIVKVIKDNIEQKKLMDAAKKDEEK